MFGAIGRWLKALGYLMTFRFDAAAKEISRHPGVMKARFESIIRGKKSTMKMLVDAVSSIIGMQEEKKAKYEAAVAEIKKKTMLRDGAGAVGRKRVQELQRAGKTPDEIKADPEVVKWSAAYGDHSSTLEQLQIRAEDYRASIVRYDEELKGHKLRLMGLKREIEDLKGEAASTVADMISALEERKMNEAIAGISDTGVAAELEDLRTIARETKAAARITRELAGTDTAVQEEELLKYARENVANDEFLKVVGLSEAPVAAAPAKEAAVKLPER